MKVSTALTSQIHMVISISYLFFIFVKSSGYRTVCVPFVYFAKTERTYFRFLWNGYFLVSNRSNLTFHLSVSIPFVSESPPRLFCKKRRNCDLHKQVLSTYGSACLWILKQNNIHHGIRSNNIHEIFLTLTLTLETNLHVRHIQAPRASSL